MIIDPGNLALGPSALGLSFLAGATFGLSPLPLAALPVALAHLSRCPDEKARHLWIGLFFLGTVATHAALGATAGLGGRWGQALIGRHWAVPAGAILIALGALWVGIVRLPVGRIGLAAWRVSKPWSAFLLGIPFTVAVCPVCTPALVVALGMSLGAGSPLGGAALLMVFAIGRMAPILLGTWVLARLARAPVFSGIRRSIEIGAGLVLIVTGLFLLNSYFFWVPALAG